MLRFLLPGRCVLSFAVLCLLTCTAHAVGPVKLTASDAVANGWFGTSVSISGDSTIVGARGTNGTAGILQGAAYVFTHTGVTWTQQAKLTASDATAFDLFGISVSMSGDTVIVGADFADGTAGTNQGAAYVYTRTGTVWTQQAKLTASDAAVFDHFGISVSMSGDTVIVGAFLDDGTAGTDQGAAYVYTRVGTTWTQQAKLTAADAAADDLFGRSVSIHGDTVIVGADFADGTAGADQGAAYVFTRTGTTWTQQAKLTAADAAAGDIFGNSVSINADTAIIGAQFADIAAGAAYVFTRTGTTWSQQAKLSASKDRFGISVSIKANTALIGARDIPLETMNNGAAYVFTRIGTTWTQQAKLTAADAAPGALFGRAVSIYGDTVIVGADLTDGTAGIDQGAAYIFTLCIQDLDGDNAVDGADLGLLLGNWGGLGITDLNGDGTTNGADLGLLLGAWGACP